jgi:hypothetical protein
MKARLTTILLITTLLTGILCVSSCKKEHVKQVPEASVIDENNEAILAHIQDFKSRMENHKANPGLKSGTLYTPPDAVEEVEALINFNFCYTDISCNKKSFEKTEVTMPLDELGKIGESRLAQLYYEEIIDSIQARMLDVNYPNMKLLLVDLEQTGTDSNGDAIIGIGALIGNEGSFNITGDVDGWWYGNLDGTCEENDTLQGTWDAASELQSTIYATLVPAPPPGYVRRTSVLYTEEITMPNQPKYRKENDVMDNFMDFKIYYASNNISGFPITDSVRCVSDDYEIPNYLSSYTEVINNVIEEQSTIHQINMSFINCIVEGYDFENETYIQHNFFFQIGKRWFIPTAEIEIENILSY